MAKCVLSNKNGKGKTLVSKNHIWECYTKVGLLPQFQAKTIWSTVETSGKRFSIFEMKDGSLYFGHHTDIEAQIILLIKRIVAETLNVPLININVW
jgi:hypothetical protein